MNTINNRILESMNRNSERVAIEYMGLKITYDELHKAIQNLSVQIQSLSNIKNKIVVIDIASPVKHIISQLAVLFNGGICLPIDSSIPIEYYALDRVENIACLIGDEAIEGVEGFTIQVPELDQLLCAPSRLTNDVFDIENVYSYCFMTSGTTNHPKLISLSQNAILNQVEEKISLLQIDSTSKIYYSMNFSFVASLWQFMAPLFVGGTVVLATEHELQNPYEVFLNAVQYKASILCVVPSALKVFFLQNKKDRKIKLKGIETLVLTGELLESNIVKCFLHEFPNVTVVNAYGQTETSDDIFHYVVPKDFDYEKNKIIPIGFPIKNIRYVIVDDTGEAVENENLKGELCISGTCIGEKNCNLFQKLIQIDGETFYCTGDVVSKTKEGLVICYGRKDHQIKIHGQRIQPEHIEVVSTGYPGIKDAIAIKIEQPTSEYIHLQYELESDYRIDVRGFRDYLAANLPSYMVPAIITRTNQIPYNNHGKKIRNLRMREIENCDGFNSQDTILNLDSMKALVCTLIRRIKGISNGQRMKYGDYQLEILNSLEFVNLLVQLEEILKIEVDVNKFYLGAFANFDIFIEYLLTEYKKGGGKR